MPVNVDPDPADAARVRAGAPGRVLTVRTMSDRRMDGGVRGGASAGMDGSGGRDDGGTIFPVSALEGTGLDRLRAAMLDAAFSGSPGRDDDSPVLTRDRQVEGVRTAAREMRHFSDALYGGIPPEVASAHLKAAATATEELLGTIGTKDVLDRVFSDFCIGK